MKTEIKIKKGLSAERHGFSLMEVVMVIAIIAIMTAIGLIAVQSTRSKTALEAAANEVMASLRETQNYALTGKLGNETEKCSGYRFQSVANTDRYSIAGQASAGSTCSFSVNQKLSGGVTFNGVYSETFSVPHGNVSNASLTIGLSRGGNNYYVCVNGAGRITKGPTTGC